jgi:hypothetical protein
VFVPSFSTRTSAAGTTAPVLSVTVPTMEARSTCPQSNPAKIINPKRHRVMAKLLSTMNQNGSSIVPPAQEI